MPVLLCLLITIGWSVFQLFNKAREKFFLKISLFYIKRDYSETPEPKALGFERIGS